MDEVMKCECGSQNMLWVGDRVRCMLPNCNMEMKMIITKGKREYLQRRWNLEELKYNENWEGMLESQIPEIHR